MSLDHATHIVKHQTATRDAFLGGRLVLEQAAKGFRAGLDSVLLGASVTAKTGELLDLGAGVGTAALVALAHNEGLSAKLVDSDAETIELAARNIAGNGFGGRASAFVADVTSAGAERAAAGIAVDHYAAVIANPPFFVAGEGTLAGGGEGARAKARHMASTDIDLWVRAAAAAAAPSGEIVFVYPAEGLPALLAAFDARFGAITVLPLSPRTGEPSRRVFIRGIKGSRAPLTLLPARTVHGEGKAFSPEIEAILRGTARLHW